MKRPSAFEAFGDRQQKSYTGGRCGSEDAAAAAIGASGSGTAAAMLVAELRRGMGYEPAAAATARCHAFDLVHL